MIDGMREWLLGVTAAALLAALADCLVSQGAIRKIARLAGGLLLLAALLRPLGSLPLGELSVSFAEYRRQTAELTEHYRAEQSAVCAAVIEEELGAYIVDKAAGMGLRTEARVTAGPGAAGAPLPEEVRLTIPMDPVLSAWLETELGIPAEAQDWQEG